MPGLVGVTAGGTALVAAPAVGRHHLFRMQPSPSAVFSWSSRREGRHLRGIHEAAATLTANDYGALAPAIEGFTRQYPDELTPHSVLC
ncbi:MAG: hypothetical protein U0531_01400 [Dehalococcoidia bacterium]